jgi:hypothetical protein
MATGNSVRHGCNKNDFCYRFERRGHSDSCSIVEAALRDGIEMVTLIAVMETQNKDGVTGRLSDAGAAQAGIVIRNAILCRLATMVMREFARSRDGDLHIGRAIELLKGNTLAHFRRVGSADKLEVAIAQWKKLRGDHRHERLKEFRDKEAAHIGMYDPKVPKPLWGELLEFCEATIDLIDLLAAGTGMANVKVRDNVDAQLTASAFWKPWHAYAP